MTDITLMVTFDELKAALIASGLSYKQPPEQDTKKVWEALVWIASADGLEENS